MKIVKLVLGATLLLVVGYITYAFIEIRSMQVEVLDDDLFVIRGLGSNATIVSTPSGAVVIDSMTFPMQGEIIKAKAEELTGQKVVLLINTHYHLDHTHGNPGFDAGTKVVSTERTLSHLKALDADFWEGESALLLPNETFTDRKVFDLSGQKITVVHPGRGHTDGDLVVFLHKHDTVVMGDLYFNHYYPNIDLEAGGSVKEWSATIENVLSMQFTQVIPGHGATSDRAGLKQFQGFMTDLAEIGQTSLSNGASLDDTLKQATLSSDSQYHEIVFVGIPLGLDREFVIRRAWEEATGNFELKN